MATFLSIIGFLGIPVGFYLTALTVRGGQTGWAYLWLVIYFALDMAALWASNEPRRSRLCALVGAVLLGGLMAARLLPHRDTSQSNLVFLPSGHQAPWYFRLAEESDLAGIGFVAFSDFGAITSDESRVARPALGAAYRHVRADAALGSVPSPAVANLLGMVSGTSFPTVVIHPPPAGEQSPRAVVVLHGLGGSLNLPCAMLAHTMPDALIVCPSVGMGAEWGGELGLQVFNAAVAYAQERSPAVYILGMSSGATGAETLLSRNQLGHVAGGVLLSGYNEEQFEAVRHSDIPLLIIRGDHDQRTPAFDLHGVAQLDHVQILEIAGGHYVYLEQTDTVLTAVDEFCAPR